MVNNDPGSQTLQFFPVDIGHYRNHPPLDTGPEVDGIAELLAPFGGVAEGWKATESERGADAVEDRLTEWSQPQIAADTVLYWVGHGESDGRTALLAHARSPRPLTAGGVSPEYLLGFLATRQAHRNGAGGWAIVIIDACKSARFVQLMSAHAHLDPTGPDNFLLVASSQDGIASLGAFRRALSTVLTVTFHGQDSIDLRDLATELNRNLHGCPAIAHTVTGRALLKRSSPALAGALHAPLDLLAEIEAVFGTLTDDERRHFILKASGAELGEQAWYFEGRKEEQRRILTWLGTVREGMLVITGAAGAGKSALLGHVLVHTRPELRDLLERAGHLAPLPTSTPRPAGGFDAVIHLTGATPQDLLARIAQAAGTGGRPPTGEPIAQQAVWLLNHFRDRNRPFTLLVDALDEAHLPLVMADQILRRLASCPEVRVVVGTRRSTHEGPDLPYPDDQNLLDALGAQRVTVIDVERDRRAMTAYVRRRLSAAVRRGLLPLSVPRVDQVARELGGLEREFLYAQLAVHEIIQSPQLADDLDVVLRSDHRQLFARAVDRLSEKAAAYRPLLEALALAQGHGLPLRDGVWATAAASLGVITVSDADIDDLTKAAAPYLMLDTEAGQSVYRLAHRTFAEHFTRTAPTYGYDDRHQLITRRLAEEADTRLPTFPPNPYLVHHLPGHAALGGPPAWEELAAHPRLLDRLDPAAVTSGVMRGAFGRFQLPPPIAGVVSSQHLLSTAAVSDRRGIREWTTARHTGQSAAPHPGDDPVSTWSVRWARVQRRTLHLPLGGHAGPVNAIATFRSPDNRTLLATGSADGTVRIWDPMSGSAVGAPLRGHTGPVTAATVFQADDGRTLLATGGDTTVCIWDPATGTTVSVPLGGHTRGVRAVTAFTSANGRTQLAVGQGDGAVRLWDADTSSMIRVLRGHIGGVMAVAATLASDGQPLLATGGHDGTVRLWDSASGYGVGVLRGGVGRVRAVTTIPGKADRRLLAAGGGNGLVRLWDLDSRKTVGLLRDGIGRVRTLTPFPDADGRALLAVGGDDGLVRFWDPSSHSIDVLRGGAGRVRTMKPLPVPDGRTLLATGGDDGLVRLWDPASLRPVSGQRSRSRGVNAVVAIPASDGRGMVATAGATAVRLWGWASGRPDGVLCEYSYTYAGLGVTGLAAVPLRDSRTLLAVSYEDGRVCLWDPKSHKIIRKMRTGPSRVRTMSALPTPDGHTVLAMGSEDGLVRFWDPLFGTLDATDHSGRTLVMAPLPTPDGRTLLATGGDDRIPIVYLWNPESRKVDGVLRDINGRVRAMTSLPGADGRTLLAIGGDDGLVYFWDPQLRKAVSVRRLHKGPVRTATSFSGEDGHTLLATGGDDGTVRVWKPAAEAGALTIPLGIAIHGIAAIGTDLALATAEGVVCIAVKPTERHQA